MADWIKLQPNPWGKRRTPEPARPPIGPPPDKYGTMTWHLDPASPAADALRELRARLKEQEEA